jgi:hypothetical protein
VNLPKAYAANRSRKFFAGWESVCLVTIGPPKILLQALIQLAAALWRHVPPR